jgi:flagellar hook assembly protein FlgD
MKISGLSSSPSSVQIFDGTGELIRTISSSFVTANGYAVIWDGRNDKGRMAARGIYYYVINQHVSKTAGKIYRANN